MRWENEKHGERNVDRKSKSAEESRKVQREVEKRGGEDEKRGGENEKRGGEDEKVRRIKCADFASYNQDESTGDILQRDGQLR